MKTKVLLNTDIIDHLDSQASDKPVSARAVFILRNLINRCPYRVGDVFMTTLNEPPDAWPDVEWTQQASSNNFKYYVRTK